MKMIIAIVDDDDCDTVIKALISDGLRVTRIASTGGFLRRGNSTMMLGLDDDKVDQAIHIIRDHTTTPAGPGMRRATIFVLNVDQFTQL